MVRLYLGAFLCLALALHVAADCRPCRGTDGVQCTHPGNADNAWCQSRCTAGVNNAICPASHCYCTGSPMVQRRCVPCAQGDVGCSQPGVASQAWCDQRCQMGVNNDLCPVALCKCTSAKSAGRDKFTALASADDCRPCKASDGTQCTHPGNANVAWCKSRCTSGKNTDVCPASHCWCKGSTSVPSKCSPCKKGDSGCTQPGVASQAWCDSRCQKGVNNDLCPKTLCKCPAAKASGKERMEETLATPPPTAPKCRPCKKTDGTQCTHPGNADQKWCDQHCPKGKNDQVCVSSFCWCPGSTPVPSKCTPCKKGDSGCTNPGNADQKWCDANCDKGVNTLQCPESHCKCPAAKGAGLKTEQRTETIQANADEKTSSAKTRDRSAMWGALGLGLGCVALVSLVAAVVVRKRGATPESLTEEQLE